jgi:hypothetical protein
MEKGSSADKMLKLGGLDENQDIPVSDPGIFTFFIFMC